MASPASASRVAPNLVVKQPWLPDMALPAQSSFTNRSAAFKPDRGSPLEHPSAAGEAAKSLERPEPRAPPSNLTLPEQGPRSASIVTPETFSTRLDVRRKGFVMEAPGHDIPKEHRSWLLKQKEEHPLGIIYDEQDHLPPRRSSTDSLQRRMSRQASEASSMPSPSRRQSSRASISQGIARSMLRSSLDPNTLSPGVERKSSVVADRPVESSGPMRRFSASARSMTSKLAPPAKADEEAEQRPAVGHAKGLRARRNLNNLPHLHLPDLPPRVRGRAHFTPAAPSKIVSISRPRSPKTPFVPSSRPVFPTVSAVRPATIPETAPSLSRPFSFPAPSETVPEEETPAPTPPFNQRLDPSPTPITDASRKRRRSRWRLRGIVSQDSEIPAENIVIAQEKQQQQQPRAAKPSPSAPSQARSDVNPSAPPSYSATLEAPPARRGSFFTRKLNAIRHAGGGTSAPLPVAFKPPEAVRVPTPPLADDTTGDVQDKLADFFFDFQPRMRTVHNQGNAPKAPGGVWDSDALLMSQETDLRESSSSDEDPFGQATVSSSGDPNISSSSTAHPSFRSPQREPQTDMAWYFRARMGGADEGGIGSVGAGAADPGSEAPASRTAAEGLDAAEPDAEQIRARLEWEIPEHLPASPLCPLNPKYRGKARGLCVFHGLAKAKDSVQAMPQGDVRRYMAIAE